MTTYELDETTPEEAAGDPRRPQGVAVAVAAIDGNLERLGRQVRDLEKACAHLEETINPVLRDRPDAVDRSERLEQAAVALPLATCAVAGSLIDRAESLDSLSRTVEALTARLTLLAARVDV